MKKVKEQVDSSIIIFLVGNKKDLNVIGNRVVTKEETEKYAENIVTFYVETSAINKD